MFILIFVIVSASALHCDKVFNYYDNYGNGFDITCQGITSDYIHILQNITINHEISLTIENSTITNVGSELFHRVSNLKYLFIHNSVFTFPKTEQIFKYLNYLGHLEIKNTIFQVNQYTFTGLNQLKDLVMSNNNLSNIEEGSFKHFPHLKKFQMTLNRISDIGNLPLCEIRDLDTLNISENSISTLKVPNLHCKSLNQRLDLNLNNENYILNVAKDDFQSVADYGLRLSHIDLSYNKIREVGDVLIYLKFVRILKLQGNSLSHLRNVDFAHVNDLEEIHLENNNITLIEEMVFDDKVDLQYIDISHNRLVTFTINELPLLDYLNLGYNELSNSNFNISSINTMKSLRNLYLNSNKFTIIEPHAFQWYSSLELLDLADNKVIFVENSLHGLAVLKTLILRNNSIEELPSDVFSSLTHLKTLDLSHNKLKSLMFNKTFQHLRNLETLNISFNLIDGIDYDIFEPLGNLRVLDISGNKLVNIQFELILSNLKLLSVLDIKSNLLSCEILYSIIQYLKKKNVTYTLVEKFDYERENVAGIYCSSGKASLRIVNDSSEGNNVLVNISVAVTIMLVIIITCIALFKMYIYLKRRKYRPDEFELINE